MIVRLCFLLFVSVLPVGPVSSAEVLLKIGRIKEPVKLDGELGEWGRASRISPLRTSSGALPTKTDVLYLAYDDSSLYFAYRCRSEFLLPFVLSGKNRERLVVRINSGRFLLSPDPQKTREGVEWRWKPEVKSYSVEARIPSRSFGVRELRPGLKLRFSFSRFSPARGEAVEWGGESPSTDSTLLLETAPPVLYFHYSPPGRVKFYAMENASRFVVLTARVAIDGGSSFFERYLRLEPGGSSELECEFAVPERPFTFSVRVSSVRSDELYLQTPSYLIWERRSYSARPTGILTRPRKYKPLGGSFPVIDLKRILISRDATASEKASAGMLQAELERSLGVQLPVKKGGLAIPKGSIIVGCYDRFFLCRAICEKINRTVPKTLGYQGYILYLRDSIACVVARQPEGVLSGASTLAQMIRASVARDGKLPNALIIDGPEIYLRGSPNIVRSGESPEEFYSKLAFYKINLCKWREEDYDIARRYRVYMVKPDSLEVLPNHPETRSKLPTLKLWTTSRGYRELLPIETPFALVAGAPEASTCYTMERFLCHSVSYSAETGFCRMVLVEFEGGSPFEFIATIIASANAWSPFVSEEPDYYERLGAVLFGSKSLGEALQELDHILARHHPLEARESLLLRLSPAPDLLGRLRKIRDTFLRARYEQSLALRFVELVEQLLVGVINRNYASLYNKSNSKEQILKKWLEELEELNSPQTWKSIEYLRKMTAGGAK